MSRLKRRKSRRTTMRTKSKNSLGKFVGTPSQIHGWAKISHENTTIGMQKAIIQSFHKLNGHKEICSLSVADHSGNYDGELTFEVGVANDTFFNYLSNEATEKLYNLMKSEGEYNVLDFLVIVAYHYSREGKRVPLSFDHYILHFSFYRKMIKISLSHVKGTRRMPLDDLLNIIIDRISLEASCLDLKTISTETIKTLS